ncbi:MAG TPA: hypothetical protein VFH17_05255 [Coriobacteriia bacterium]|nr:hypothetical protein [Coriobacteriia bacterium]
MSLGDVPIATPCLVSDPRLGPDSERYAVAGISRGAVARVLARYPVAKPAFAEVEIEGTHLVTVPISLARSVDVEPIDSTEVAS